MIGVLIQNSFYRNVIYFKYVIDVRFHYFLTTPYVKFLVEIFKIRLSDEA